MRFGWSPKDSSVRVRNMAKAAALLFVGAYTMIYLAEPFSDLWNIILTNAFLVAASSVTAAIATMIWAQYDLTDPPRRVWGFFAAGLWLWSVAELIWGYINVTIGEVPEGIADIFWIGAYFLFWYAFWTQYRVVAQPARQELWRHALMAVLFLLAAYLLIYCLLISGVEAQTSFDAAINSFYPAADLLMALVALWLASNFVGGAFSRPWLGMLAFAFADLLYAWLELSGLYAWSVDQSNVLSTISDVVYLGAYLILGLGILSHWAFLRYGLRTPTHPR